jgi:hypothetical protein
MNRRVAPLVVALSLFAGGCVVGNSYKFDYVPGERTTVGQGRTVVLVPVVDEREFVVSKDEPASLVGEMRNGYGMPFNVSTEGDRPFADVVTDAVQRDLEAAGFTVVRGTAATGSNRALAVQMKNFLATTNVNTSLEWDFLVRVLDAAGSVLAEKRESGDQDLQGSMMNPVKAAKNEVPKAFYGIVHRMITGEPRILSALSGR